MKLIKDLGTKRNNNNKTERWGLFYCEYCHKEVKKPYRDGLRAKSCRCMHDKLISMTNTTHGCACKGRTTKLYSVWVTMKQRCCNPDALKYKDYGQRGIKICDEWLEFVPFRQWALSNGYGDNLTIERINNNGNYEPLNCKWATCKEQSRNTRRTKLTLKIANQIRSIYNNIKITRKLLSKIFNVSINIINNIINNKTWVD